MSRFRRLALVLLVIVVAAPAVLVGLVKVVYGTGEELPAFDAGPPRYEAEVAATLDLPPGCVTVSPDGRVFFDTHPFAAPERFDAPHVFELVDGRAVPWPSAAAQSDFVAPFGLTADDHGRLWLTEPATLDRPATRLLAYDLATGEQVFVHTLPDGVARFAQDLRVSPDGGSLVLADTGAFRLTAGQLVVFDIDRREVVRTLRHPSLDARDVVITRYDGQPHRVGWGLLTFQVGVDGITFSADGEWLVFATMSSDELHRVPADRLLDPTASDAEVAAAIEAIGRKPLSDGIATDGDRVLVTDVEHGGIVSIGPDGTATTLTRDRSVVWADSVEVGPDGDIWYTDSAIPAYLQPLMTPPPRSVLTEVGPYHLYRIDR